MVSIVFHPYVFFRDLYYVLYIVFHHLYNYWPSSEMTVLCSSLPPLPFVLFLLTVFIGYTINQKICGNNFCYSENNGDDHPDDTTRVMQRIQN